MTSSYKPQGYNAVSPYFVVTDAQKLIDLLIELFDGEQLRSYPSPDGSILHAEIKIQDSVLMFGEASDRFPANQLLIHVYVPDVDAVFNKAVHLGCQPLETPKTRDGDPDKRGSFKDFAGNVWSIGTQCD